MQILFTTPCRPIFDASMPTSSGLCLNDILAKGSNDMNQLLLIFLRWRIRTHAHHTDLQTMYNKVGLKPEHWCYQLYYYHDSLDPDIEPRIKVNKTLTYGVRSSGNQAERAVQKTAEMQKLEFPRENEVINDDTYVDEAKCTMVKDVDAALVEPMDLMMDLGDDDQHDGMVDVRKNGMVVSPKLLEEDKLFCMRYTDTSRSCFSLLNKCSHMSSY